MPSTIAVARSPVIVSREVPGRVSWPKRGAAKTRSAILRSLISSFVSSDHHPRSRLPHSEFEFCDQLQHARRAYAAHRAESVDVDELAAGIIRQVRGHRVGDAAIRQAAAHSAELGVIKDVEGFAAKQQPCALLQRYVLLQRHIPVVCSRPVYKVARTSKADTAHRGKGKCGDIQPVIGAVAGAGPGIADAQQSRAPTRGAGEVDAGSSRNAETRSERSTR